MLKIKRFSFVLILLLLLLINVSLINQVVSYALSGDITFSGTDHSVSSDTVYDGYSAGGITLTDIADITINIYASGDGSTPLGNFVFYGSIITPADVLNNDYSHIVIESSDGSDFNFESIEMNNVSYDIDTIITVEAILDNSSLGSVDVELSNDASFETLDSSSGLTSIFENVDKIVLTYTSAHDDILVGLRKITISDAVIPTKTLTADTSDNDVDHDIVVTFSADATFEGDITSVTYNSNTLDPSQYDIASGSITLKPSVDGNDYLKSPATANLVIKASGYGDSSVTQTIKAGAVSSLEVITQPLVGSENGANFATQPAIKLIDQYGNDCTDGVSSNADVVASSKDGTGSFTLGGTTTEAATSGQADFTNLSTTLVSVGDASLTFTSGGKTIDSSAFVIPLNAEKTLTADTSDNDVDHDIVVTFSADATFESAITSVTYNSNVLDPSQYDIASGSITLKPSVDGNDYLRANGTSNLVISATGYVDSSVSQSIKAGEVASLELITQPIVGGQSGANFTVQPLVKLIDKYGNYCTDGVSSSANIVVSAKDGTGSFTLGGTTTKASIAGVSDFTDLSTTSISLGDAKITFTIGSVTVDSDAFTLPKHTARILTADTVDNDVDHDIVLTFTSDASFEAAITSVTYNSNTLDASQYDIASGSITLKPSVDGNDYLRNKGTANLIISSTGYFDSSVSQTIKAGEVASLELTTQPIVGSQSGALFTVQPLVKLIDKYGNYCTDGVSSSANIVASAKNGTGSFTLGGTTTKASMAGISDFTDLSTTLISLGDAKLTFTIGSVTVDSDDFTLPKHAARVLTADTSDNDVDHDIVVTFTADANFESAITSVTYNSNTLDASQYDIASGSITLKPSVDGNTYLRSMDTANLVIKASAYNDSSVSQVIKAGEVASLEVTTQPGVENKSGENFSTQPIVKLKDQYGNYCVDGVSASLVVVASSKDGSGSFTLGGTTTEVATSGQAEFTSLSTTLVSVGDASLTFTSSGKTIDSSTFIIPLNAEKTLTADTSDNDVDHDIVVTFTSDASFEAAITSVSYNSNTLDASQYDIASGSITLKPSVDGNDYLRNRGAANLVISATGYFDSSVSQIIKAGEVASLEVNTQPIVGGQSGANFTVQPLVKLKDKYGNYCTDGVSSSANIVASAKDGTGSFTLGGTTTKASITGVSDFTDLSTTLISLGDAKVTFTIGSVTVDSDAFTLPKHTARVLTADTSDNDVDHDIVVTFTSDANFEGAITSVSYNSNTLDASQYDIASGSITLKPSVDGNTYLRNRGTANLVISATGYFDSSVSQTIKAGEVASLEVNTQPIVGGQSGALFTVQPLVKLKDKYGNYCTNGVSASANIVASAKEGTASFTLGGTTTKASIAGVSDFTDLSTTLISLGDAKVTFTVGSVTVDSDAFTLPKNAARVLTADTSDNDVDHDLLVTFTADANFESAITSVTYNSNTLDPSQYDIESGSITLKPSVDGNDYLRANGTSNLVISATGYVDSSVSQSINHGANASLLLSQEVMAPTSNGAEFSQQATVSIIDQYANICTSDSTTVISASKFDTGSWTLNGEKDIQATNGIVIYSLSANNTTQISGAQIAFDSIGLTQITSGSLLLPAPASSSSGGGSSSSSSSKKDKSPSEKDNSNTTIIINGKRESMGKTVTSVDEGAYKSTVTVDPIKLKERLDNETTNATITIAPKQNTAITVCELDGQIVKNMEDKEAILEIKTKTSSYTVPAKEIDIDSISKKIGEDIELVDVKIDIEISKPKNAMVEVVENSVDKAKLSIVIEPIEFEITAVHNEKKYVVDTFKSFVKRNINIPAGVDPSKITTAIVVDPDGSIRHVPTKVVVNNGIFSAEINSLTNSTYTIVWNPVEFKNLANHPSKDAINDLASRMILSANSDGIFEVDSHVTRAEFSSFIVKALGLKLIRENNSFSDVNSQDWYKDYVETAYSYGIINGHGDGTFCPNSNITREEAAVILNNAMIITKISEDKSVEEIKELLCESNCLTNVSKWAKDSMANCINKNIISVDGSKRLDPKSEITKAEIAEFIQKFLKESDLI